MEKEIEIKNGVTEIDAFKYDGNTELEHVFIPASVVKIGAGAFRGCVNLSDVQIEDGANALEIGESAFEGCTGLRAIELPGRSSRFLRACFKNSGLEEMTIGQDGDFIACMTNEKFAGCPAERLLENTLENERMSRVARVSRRKRNIVAETAATNQGISKNSVITGPGEVIEFISRAENSGLIGHEIAHVYSIGDPGSCVQMGQYFCQTKGDSLSVHFEVEAVNGQVYVEIHSELGNTPIAVHDFLYSQFRVGHDLTEKGVQRVCDDGRLRRSFRFATKRINCNGRIMHEVVADIAVALDALYKKYGAYLSYLDDYYYQHARSLSNCKHFSEYDCLCG